MPQGLTIGEVAKHYARSSSNRDRAVLVTSSASYSWRDLNDQSSRLANALLDRGLTDQGKVAVLLWNEPTYYEIMFGVAKAGGVVVPLNARLVARELGYFIQNSDAEFFITAPAFRETVEAALATLESHSVKLIVVGGDGMWGEAYEGALEQASDQAPDIDVDPDAPYWMPFTSGTTGTPKAAVITHRNLVAEWNSLGIEAGFTKSDTILLAAPIFGGVGFVFGLCALYSGGTVVLMENFDAQRALQLIEEHMVTVVPAAPTMLSMMIETPGAEDRNVSSVRAVLAMGSALSTGLRLRVEQFFTEAEGVYHPYGSTELGTCACIHPREQAGRDGSVGQGFLGAEVRLLDSSGNEVPRGEVGEIYTRGKVLSTGYYKNPAASAAIRRGEWVTSNDLGRFDEDGFLYVVDRTKDMIVSGGLNVYSNEVEEVISLHAGVGQVAVIGVPDAKWGEVVTAYITTAGGEKFDVESLLEHCRQNLADFKRPKSVVVVQKMPTSPTGKVMKRALREEAVQQSTSAATRDRA
jgi:acyl-CoA synthetase (AMP-forming)/AMP-acid ligase II